MVSPFMPDADKLAAVRAALPSLSAAIQLNTGSVGPIPAESAAAMAQLAEYERDFGRAQPEYWEELKQRIDEARAGVAAIIGGELDEVAITHAATDGMNIGTWAIDWGSGGRAVTTCQEHPGGVGPLYMVADRYGVDLGFAEFGPDAPDDEAPERIASTETPLARFWSDFRRSRIALAGLVLLGLVVAIALFAPWIAPQNPYDLAALDLLDARLPPGAKSAAGSVYWLGTDGQGRDMLSAIFYGLRISLYVGVASGIVAFTLGSLLGVLAAYLGGRFEQVIMRIVDIQLGFPAILVALVLLAVLGKGVDKIIVALATVQWAYYARTARSAALVERGKEYMEAARGLGLSKPRIVLRHLMPNALAPLIVVATVQVAHAIALEATLSFLGLGLPATEPSLGLLIATGYEYLLSGKYWISVYPGVALLLTILAINLVGDQLRDVLNPRLSR